MNANRALVGGVLLYLAAVAAFASQPFNSCTFSVDDDGFIVVDDEYSRRRFFPLATFFYPAVGPEMGGGGGTGTLGGDYAAFEAWGGNCVICPWEISHWSYLPGALFESSATCAAHLEAAYFAHCKVIADPTLFWGDEGIWSMAGSEVGTQERVNLFNAFKAWCEDSYADALLGYWQWPEPAWRYWNSPTGVPTAGYLANAYNHLRDLDPYHGVFMGQNGRVVVHELWRDYFLGSDCSAALIEPCPAPDKIDDDPNAEYFLPNHYYSVVGDLADVAHEAARSHTLMPPPPPHRNQPYIAILQGFLEDDNDCPPFWYRFMAFDAIIHGAKGLAWYDEYGGSQPGDWYWPSMLSFLPVLQELDRLENEYGLLTADYDSPLVRVITKSFGNEVERSAFVGGKLVPKTHFLSSERIMEGCAKIVDGTTYLIVACRASPGQQPVAYTVEFYPYYSAYDFETYWPGPVNKLVLGGAPVSMGMEDGTWSDTFNPGDVNIYYFTKPAPWQPPEPPPGG